MLEEDAGCARHGQHIGIGCQRILLQRILSRIGAFLRVVVLDESDGILAIGTAAEVAADERPVAFVLLAQPLPVAIVTGIADGIAELEVEGCAGLFGAVNPFADGVAAVPALADGELRFRVLVVYLGIRGAVAFYHIVAETGIAEVVEQEVEIGLDNALHILTLMVEVAHTAPAFARVVVGADAVAVGCSPFLGRAVIVVGADISGNHLVVLTIPTLLREIYPVGEVATVVDDHVGDGAETGGLEGLDH